MRQQLPSRGFQVYIGHPQDRTPPPFYRAIWLLAQRRRVDAMLFFDALAGVEHSATAEQLGGADRAGVAGGLAASAVDAEIGIDHGGEALDLDGVVGAGVHAGAAGFTFLRVDLVGHGCLIWEENEGERLLTSGSEDGRADRHGRRRPGPGGVGAGVSAVEAQGFADLRPGFGVSAVGCLEHFHIDVDVGRARGAGAADA